MFTLVIFIIWVILVILAIILILVYSDNTGVTNFPWVVIIAGIIAIIFGVVLLMCSKEGANRLSWRKRMLMYSVLDNLEEKELKNTEFGIRAGKEGAWIELGNKTMLGKSFVTKINSDLQYLMY